MAKKSKDPFGFEELIPNWQDLDDHEIIAIIIAKCRRVGSEYQICNLKGYKDVQFHIKMLIQHLGVQEYKLQHQLAEAVKRLCAKAVNCGYATKRLTNSKNGRSVQVTARHRVQR